MRRLVERLNELNERTIMMNEQFALVDYDERVLATFSTTKNVENAQIHAQICMVFGYTSDDCMILPADEVDDENWDRESCDFPCIDEMIDLY